MTQLTPFQPMFSGILLDRRLGRVICGATLLQLILTLFHFPGWPCPVLNLFGVPCPGCGLTRATLFLVQGEWKQALTMHAFAPILIVALAIITFCAMAPRDRAQQLAEVTRKVERYTGLTILLLGGLILYWLARLLILQGAFVRMIQG